MTTCRRTRRSSCCGCTSRTLDPQYKPALDKAINFVLESQYPIGGWPQRYPLKYDFSHHGKPDYSSFLTFNDDVVWENVNFLHAVLPDPRRGALARSDHPRHELLRRSRSRGRRRPAGRQQYTLDLKPAGARTYEPNGAAAGLHRGAHPAAAAVLPAHRRPEVPGGHPRGARLAGPLPPAASHDRGREVHPSDVRRDRHRQAAVRAPQGHPTSLNGALLRRQQRRASRTCTTACKDRIDVARLRKEYEALAAMKVEEATRDSPLLPGRFTAEGTPQKAYDVKGADRYTASGLDNTASPGAHRRAGAAGARPARQPVRAGCGSTSTSATRTRRTAVPAEPTDAYRVDQRG